MRCLLKLYENKNNYRLTNTTILDMEITNNGSLQKAKFFLKKGRKAAGAEQVFGLAKLPKNEP